MVKSTTDRMGRRNEISIECVSTICKHYPMATWQNHSHFCPGRSSDSKKLRWIITYRQKQQNDEAGIQTRLSIWLQCLYFIHYKIQLKLNHRTEVWLDGTKEVKYFRDFLIYHNTELLLCWEIICFHICACTCVYMCVFRNWECLVGMP